MTDLKEKEIEKLILHYLDFRQDCFAWKNDNTGVYDPKIQRFRKVTNRYKIAGVADILGIYKGRPLAIEVKSAKGRPTTPQKEFLKRFTEHGGIAFIARSVADVTTELAKHCD